MIQSLITKEGYRKVIWLLPVFMGIFAVGTILFALEQYGYLTPQFKETLIFTWINNLDIAPAILMSVSIIGMIIMYTLNPYMRFKNPDDKENKDDMS